MKNILTRDRDLLRTDVYMMTISQLKDLNLGLFVYMKKNFHNYTGVEDPRHDMVIDLERKQTIVMGELQRRGYLSKKDRPDYFKWLYGQHQRRLY